MYVPGFPAMGDALGAGTSAVQLTMTAFLAGLVVGQLLIGPQSDGLGRRRLLISGSAGFVLFSLLCAVAPNVTVLTGARFLQGVSGAAGMALARAVLTDRFHGAELPRRFAVLSQIMGVAPIAAPVLGGAILGLSTWRAVFAVLAVLGAALLPAVIRTVPDPLPPERREGGGFASTFRAMGALLGRRAFMGYVLVVAFVSAALFAYISGSSFVFESLHGVSATTYSLIFATNAVGMLLGGAVFSRLAGKRHLSTLLAAGVGVCLLGALAKVLLVVTVGETLAGTWITLFVTAGGIGLVFPGRHEPRPGGGPGGRRCRVGAAGRSAVPLRGAGLTTGRSVRRGQLPADGAGHADRRVRGGPLPGRTRAALAGERRTGRLDSP